MKIKKVVAALGIALACVGGTAQAQTVMAFQDDNIDFLLNSDGTPKTTGTFAVGDILVSVFEIQTFTIGGVNAIPAGQELTGVAAVQLTGGDGSLATPWTFGATSLGLNTWTTNDVVGGGANGGATIAMYLNPTADFNLDIDFASNVAANCTSLVNCYTEATAGNLLQVDGFAGDADEFWQATAAILGGGDVDVVGGTSGAITVANFLAAQSNLFNATGPIAFQTISTGAFCPGGTTGADGCIAGPVLSGPVSGGAGLNSGITADGGFARSDFDLVKLQAVPEPGSLALLSLGLTGLAFFRRKNQA